MRTLIAELENGSLYLYVRTLKELNILPGFWAEGYRREVVEKDVLFAAQYLSGICEVEGKVLSGNAKFYYCR